MTKERLKTYIDIREERDDLNRRIKDIEDDLYALRSQLLDGMPRGSSGENYVTEELIDQKEELLVMYKVKEGELTAELLVIETAIEKLEPRERRLVRLHYIDGLTWEQVAVEMTYSWRQVHRIHGEALEKLKEEEATT